MSGRRAALLLFLCAWSARPAPAQDADPPADPPADSGSAAGELEDELVERRHSAHIGGQELDYTSLTGRLVLREENGDPRASVFYMAYLREGDGDEPRPLTFSFNGGPGSSSVWLHLGAFGPRRVDLHPEGWAPPPPYRLVDNAESILDLTDLVFIDPVSTGYSRAAGDVEESEFHGVTEDVESVAEFIRLFVSRHERWDSPLFLAGESYGTTRAAGLAGHLQGKHGMYLTGVVLVSSILSFQTARFDTGNDLPYVLFLPTYTATAAYHGRLAPELAEDLEATLAEVEEFALGEYTLALMQGDALGEDQERAVVAKLARYTGLDPEYVRGTNLRIRIHRFVKELLRDERRTVGRLDSRFQGIDEDAVGERYEFDPSYAAIQGPFTAALNHYVRAELGFESDLPYEILTGRVRPWSYGESENRYLNVAGTLREAMTENPHLRVFVANGYYDLATPYFATHYTFAHLGLDPSLRGNVTMGHYESGHMMYIRDVDRVQLKRDLAAFYAGAQPR